MKIIQTSSVVTKIRTPISDKELEIHLSNAQKRAAMDIASQIPLSWKYDSEGNVIIEAHAYLMVED